jgi:hypothetical protein
VEIVGWSGNPVVGDVARVRDIPSARQLLRPFLDDALAMKSLRGALSESSPGISPTRMADQAVIQELAWQIASGRILLVTTHQRTSFAPRDDVEDEAPVATPEAAELVREKTSWIEIKLVDDSGRAVGGAKYQVQLPDGSTRSGTLDANGLARISEIDPGNCQVSFPSFDATDWDKA